MGLVENKTCFSASLFVFDSCIEEVHECVYNAMLRVLLSFITQPITGELANLSTCLYLSSSF